MKSIVKTVIFCGQNNIPLRGKRDDNPDDRNLQGNFQALLEFRIDSGDLKLKEHLENAPRNATYRSKTIQNEIIETVGNYISSKIIAEVKQSRMFSVMADEAADVSNKENLSLVLRYVDSSKNIREEFVGFYLCGEETTGNAIKELIITAVFNNMRTLKFKPRPTVTFFAAVNQIPGGFRLLPSVYVALTWKGSAVSQRGGRIS